MEHSKLPYIYEPSTGNHEMLILSRSEHQQGGVVARVRKLQDAVFIVTACNEHDTLKAKAELLDDLLLYITDAAKKKMSTHSFGSTVLRKVRKTLNKSQELK